MSWFADFAGKAEDFLNKVDQGAATALTKNQLQTSSFSSPGGEEATVTHEYSNAEYKQHHHTYASSQNAPSYISAAAGSIKKSNVSLLAGTANVSPAPSSSGSNFSNPAKMPSGFVRPKKSEQDVDDDLLFDFLNSSDPPTNNRSDSRRELVKVVPAIEAQDPTPPPPSSTTPLKIPSVPSTPPSTRGVSRASSMSSLSAHSIKTSEESYTKEQTQGGIWVFDSLIVILSDDALFKF